MYAHFVHNTDEAIARSVFASSTYFVDDEMFYGQDRLMLVEQSLRRSAPAAPR
jgi:2-hydroxychromene-2-carboxylate isomerase